MNLNDSGEGMVPYNSAPQQQPRGPPPPPPIETQKMGPEKNVYKQQQMDSTPIADVMGPADMMMDQAPQMMMQQQPMQQPMVAQKAQASSKNPMNLTDEQYQALIAGVCAIIAFSTPLQEKLLSAVPQFMSEGGRSTSGLIATGLIAAIIFYFAQRMLGKA
jgi:hypothetical protein